jgi:hypothetical protein
VWVEELPVARLQHGFNGILIRREALWSSDIAKAHDDGAQVKVRVGCDCKAEETEGRCCQAGKERRETRFLVPRRKLPPVGDDCRELSDSILSLIYRYAAEIISNEYP